MKRSLAYVLIILVLLAIAGTLWFTYHAKKSVVVETVPAPVATTTNQDLSGIAIYTNGEYGFSFQYPEKYTVANSFNSLHLPPNWRANALPSATGTPIVSVVAYRTENASSYPRFFDAELRIGASKDPLEVKSCLKPTVNQGETALTDTRIGGVVWKTFSFQNAATMQYEKGISYRTIHDGYCFAIEKLETGSSYKDAPNKNDIPDATLQASYDSLSSLIKNFTFARP